MTTTAPTVATAAPEQVVRPRLDRLRKLLPDHRLDAAIVSNEKDIEYLTGFCGHDTFLVVADDTAAIICDRRYDVALNPWRDSGFASVIMGTRHRLEESVKALAGEHGWKRLGFQAEHVTVAARDKLAGVLGADLLAETVGLVAGLRIRKDAHEVAAIEKAIRIQEEALTATLGQLRLGMTERAFNALLEFEMQSRGASGASFDGIIAAGPNGALPHYTPGDEPIERGALLIDWGAVADGYCGDLTRTYGVIDMPSKIREIYAIVLEAQTAAIEACRPGRACAEIDAVARDIITDAGYGEQFNHGLGHGLGKDVHEDPYFNQLSTDVILEPGMVMTVEPGIYLEGVGGVRIEDDLLITNDGHRVLSRYPKALDAALLEPGS